MISEPIRRHPVRAPGFIFTPRRLSLLPPQTPHQKTPPHHLPSNYWTNTPPGRAPIGATHPNMPTCGEPCLGVGINSRLPWPPPRFPSVRTARARFIGGRASARLLVEALEEAATNVHIRRGLLNCTKPTSRTLFPQPVFHLVGRMTEGGAPWLIGAGVTRRYYCARGGEYRRRFLLSRTTPFSVFAHADCYIGGATRAYYGPH